MGMLLVNWLHFSWVFAYNQPQERRAEYGATSTWSGVF